jgi:hypothetical protein
MLTALDAGAAIGFQPVSPEELKMTREPQAPGAAAIILYRQVDRDDNGHTSHEDNYRRIKILTEEGRKYANVEIAFVKKSQDVVSIRARTIRPDGSIADYGGQVFEKELVKARGVKILAKTFTLPDVQVGSILEYSYTMDLGEHLLFESHWILSDELFTKKSAVLTKTLPWQLRRPAFAALELAGSAAWPRTERGARPHHTDGSERHTRIPDRRLHASSQRIEVEGGFYLRRDFGERRERLLEAGWTAMERVPGKLCRKEKGDGAGSRADRCAK